ncbi:MAG: hypothetical protein ICV85_03205 [Tolypothrix sp. T3-bin4]|nr:hypothetical protein [Tolypothrix sp. T3-bin4]
MKQLESKSVSATNNIDMTTPYIDTTSQLIRENFEVVSGTNNIVLVTPLSDTTPNTPENIVDSWVEGAKTKNALLDSTALVSSTNS